MRHPRKNSRHRYCRSAASPPQSGRACCCCIAVSNQSRRCCVTLPSRRTPVAFSARLARLRRICAQGPISIDPKRLVILTDAARTHCAADFHCANAGSPVKSVKSLPSPPDMNEKQNAPENNSNKRPYRPVVHPSSSIQRQKAKSAALLQLRHN